MPVLTHSIVIGINQQTGWLAVSSLTLGRPGSDKKVCHLKVLARSLDLGWDWTLCVESFMLGTETCPLPSMPFSTAVLPDSARDFLCHSDPWMQSLPFQQSERAHPQGYLIPPA